MNAPQTIADYVALLEAGTPFTLANIGGDGEFLAITGETGINSDGRAYNPDVGAELAQVLLEPRLTFHGYNPGKADGSKDGNKRPNAEAWLRLHGINVPILTDHALEDPDFGSARINVRWVHKEIISAANVRGDLGPFIQALRARIVVVISGTHVSWSFVRDTLGGIGRYEVPSEMGWGSLGRLTETAGDWVSQLPTGAVVTWSLGYLTKVLMWRLAPLRPDLTHIDVGAVWDPYSGVLNRHGYRRATWPDAMRKNLEEAGL
jgi:hypothetical protein